MSLVQVNEPVARATRRPGEVDDGLGQAAAACASGEWRPTVGEDRAVAAGDPVAVTGGRGREADVDDIAADEFVAADGDVVAAALVEAIALTDMETSLDTDLK